MYQALLAFLPGVVFAFAAYRWASDDLGRDGRVSPGAARALAGALLLHAILVVLSSLGGVGVVPIPQVAAIAAGTVLAVGGAALLAAAGGRAGALVEALRVEPPRSHSTGAWRYTRHPLHTGWALLLGGIAVAGRSGLALALVAGLVPVLIAAARAERGAARDAEPVTATR